MSMRRQSFFLEANFVNKIHRINEIGTTAVDL